MDEGLRRARNHNQQQAAQCQWQQLFVGASEWRCGPKAARQSKAPGHQAAKRRTVGSVIAAESVSCDVLAGEGACWATAVAASGASTEPVPPSEHGQNRSECGVGGGKNCSAAGTAIDGGDGGRNTGDSCAKRSRNAVDPLTWLVRAKICLLYTSPSPRDRQKSRMPSSA